MGIVAGAVVEKEGKFLLVQEALDKSYGKWNLPGGHVNRNENLKDAAKREVKEECGIDVTLKEICFIGNIVKKSGESSVYAYFTAEMNDDNLQCDNTEIVDLKWFSYEELLSMQGQLRENGKLVLSAIKNARNKIFAPTELYNFFDDRKES